MVHKLVKYRLNSDGTIPTFLKSGVPQTTIGMFPIRDDEAFPRNRIFLGMTNDDADTSEAVGELTTKDELIEYLTTCSVIDGVQTWKQSTPEVEDFDVQENANRIWSELEILNG